MHPIRRLIWGGHGCGKTAALVDSAAELLTSGFDSAEILALSIHRPAVRGLRDLLHERLGRDIPTADVRHRAVSILQQFPAAAHLPQEWTSGDIVSALDRRMLMRRVWVEASGPETLYARYGTAPGALDWLARVFDAFAEWAGTADAERLASHVPAEAPLAELWETYRLYLALGRQLGLVAFQEVLPRTIDVLREPEVRAAVAPRAILVDDLDLFRPSELLLVQALAGLDTMVIAASTTTPASWSDDPQIRFLANWCVRLGLVPDREAAGISSSPRPCDTRYAECLTPAREVEAIAQFIAARRGGPCLSCLSDYAVVCFDPALVPLVRRTLPEWDIAVEGMEARDAYTLAIAPLVLAGMRLLAGVPFAPGELTAFLRHPVLGLPSGDTRLLVGALGGQPAGSVGPAVSESLWLAERSWPEALSEVGRLRLQQIAEVTADLRAVAMSSSAKLRAWLDRLDLRARAREQTAPALEPWAVAADEALLDRWLLFLERSEQVRAALGNVLGGSEAVEVLASSQGLVEPITPRLADAVRIWRPEELGGCSAATVWIAGLNEDVLPTKPAPLPWASSDSFVEAFDRLPGFVVPDAGDRAARWEAAEALLRRAVGRARQTLVLSWSRTDRDGRRRLPSPVLSPLIVDLPALTKAGQGDPGSVRPGSVVSMLSSRPSALDDLKLPVSTLFTTSPSAIENFLQCPRQYFYARELKLYDVASSARQALGQVVHAALRDLKTTGDDAPAIPRLVDAHWPKRDRRFGTRLREAAFRHLAEKAVAQVVEADRTSSRAGVHFLAAETSFSWRMAPDVELHGTVDRVDRSPDGLIILDYKLGSHSPSIKELLAKFAPPAADDDRAAWRPSDLQLPLYALAVERGSSETLAAAGGERVAEVGLIFPLELYTAKGKLSDKGRRLIRIVDHEPGCVACSSGSSRSAAVGLVCRDQLEQIVERALVAVAGMRSGNIEPDPREGGRTCRGCPFRTICPAPRV